MRISDWSSDVCSSDLPVRIEGPGALHVHLQISLPSVAHGTVRLNALARGEPRCLARGKLGVRHVQRLSRIIFGNGIRGTMNERLGEFDLDRDVGQMLLDCRKRPPRIAEPRELTGVVKPA